MLDCDRYIAMEYLMPIIPDDFDELDDDECAFPGDCCMPGPHFRSECHTAEMLEEMHDDEHLAVFERVHRAERALLDILQAIKGRPVPGCFELVPELVVREVELLVADRLALEKSSMTLRSRIMRAPAPGDSLEGMDGSLAVVVRDRGSTVQVLVHPAPELQEWPRADFELAVLGAAAASHPRKVP